MLNVKPVIATDLFPVERKALLDLLGTFNNDQWFSNTTCAEWSVKDIVQHLLKDDVGILSRKRDKFRIPSSSTKEFRSNKEFVEYINTKNQEWVETSRSFSPQILIDLLELTGQLTYDYWKTVDQHKIEAFVSWVSSDEKLPNWVDIAREYTERWLHQSHIREAIKTPLLYETTLFNPFIRAYMLALPLSYKLVGTREGNVIKIIVEGNAGGVWSLKLGQNDWELYDTELENPVTEITINQDVVWRLFSKGLDKEKAKESVKIMGDQSLGTAFFNTVSLIA
jgi:hypothetical protein